MASTIVVLVAHAALLLAIAGHASVRALGDTSARARARFTLVDPGRRPGTAPAPLATAMPPPQPDRPVKAKPSASDDVASGQARASAADVAPMRADSATGVGIYRAASLLDVQPRTRSAPDIDFLAGLPWSGLPLRLRLFIDAQGAVVEAQVLQGSEDDEVIERVRRMFFATRFTAGIQGGLPVPSYKDVELSVGAAS